ncbi:16S rRNA processing protein RimM [Candidatus Endolissoclinum faulkneri L2]|uniref:Ribosome maturation factor RimM n=1 Tax=Candidatus Endolissoclinum faulkneri L2 TaxID=1193729 RepID=K7YM60_9PROT|nr:ribosome maturation factor RimM [Candidatus Endolissoclinum faulkneri]AFX98592.1 16S rRNA processing protein RimM [Candidatus Endolissoclinum faulkneri L2]
MQKKIGANNIRICLGVITEAHGVHGLVKVKPFTEIPEDIAAYGPVENDTGNRQFVMRVIAARKGKVIVKVKGIISRDAAQDLKGLLLYVKRNALPKSNQVIVYHADLIGLSIVDINGKLLGKVSALYNFGAGDIIEFCESNGPLQMLPFTKQFFPTINLIDHYMVLEQQKTI